MRFHASAWIAAVDVSTPSRSNRTASNRSRVIAGRAPGRVNVCDAIRGIVVGRGGLGNSLSLGNAAPNSLNRVPYHLYPFRPDATGRTLRSDDPACPTYPSKTTD